MNNPRHISGFSLVELIVVIFILSTMAFFSIPVLTAPGMDGTRIRDANDLARLIKSIKKKAAGENRDYLMRLDDSAGVINVFPSSPGGEKEAMTTRLDGVRIPRVDLLHHLGTETPAIRFYGRGHSDMALILTSRAGRTVTLKIHPFLTDVEILEGNKRFDDCI